MKIALAIAAISLAACSHAPLPAVDEGLATEIAGIRAIDNHAHPVRYTSAGEPADRGFDALPVDNMEPQSDPVNLRPNSPAIAEAWTALFGRDGKTAKQRLIDQKRGDYPAWVLDQMGVETMLANRVSMGPSIQPPRFRWVPYADALIFPLDNSALAAQNPDRKAFFALEDQLRSRYLREAGLEKAPATLAEYLTRVVTPTLEKQKQGGAVAEKFEAAYLRSLAFDHVDRAVADHIYQQYAERSRRRRLQAAAGLSVPLYRRRVRPAGHGGSHPHDGWGWWILRCRGGESAALEPVLDDPELRKTRFVMLHGGWPFIRRDHSPAH